MCRWFDPKNPWTRTKGDFSAQCHNHVIYIVQKTHQKGVVRSEVGHSTSFASLSEKSRVACPWRIEICWYSFLLTNQCSRYFARLSPESSSKCWPFLSVLPTWSIFLVLVISYSLLWRVNSSAAWALPLFRFWMSCEYKNNRRRWRVLFLSPRANEREPRHRLGYA